MLKSIGVFIGVGLFMMSAGCGVSRAKYDALEAEKVRVEQESAEHLARLGELQTRIAPLEARVSTLTEDLSAARAEAQRLRQQALDSEAQAKTYLAQMKDLEAADARTAAQIAQLRAMAEKLQTDIRKLLEVASAETARGMPPPPVVTEQTVDTGE